MKKILLAVLVAGTLAGCERTTEADPKTVHSVNIEYRCIDGVLYYSMIRRLAVAYNSDSTVKTCEEK